MLLPFPPQCINELDDLIEWFDNGMNTLQSMPPISSEPKDLQKQLAETKVSEQVVSLSPLL